VDKQQRFARVILNGFYAYFAEFENITLAARTRFERAEWSSMQDISSRRIDIYKETVMETLDVARLIAGDQIEDLTFWAETRSLYADLVQGMTNFEIAETFYNSIFNSHFGHRSIRNEYAFVFSPQGDVPPVDMGRVGQSLPGRRWLRAGVYPTARRLCVQHSLRGPRSGRSQHYLGDRPSPRSPV
jgi:isocitrate dehydrogenase kinase/phosphatase